VCLIHAIIPIVYISEKVLNYLSSMVENCSSNLLMMHRQTMNRGNLTRLEYISILLDLSSTKDFRILLYMTDIMVKMLGLWDTNSFFSPLM